MPNWLPTWLKNFPIYKTLYSNFDENIANSRNFVSIICSSVTHNIPTLVVLYHLLPCCLFPLLPGLGKFPFLCHSIFVFLFSIVINLSFNVTSACYFSCSYSFDVKFCFSSIFSLVFYFVFYYLSVFNYSLI